MPYFEDEDGETVFIPETREEWMERWSDTLGQAIYELTMMEERAVMCARMQSRDEDGEPFTWGAWVLMPGQEGAELILDAAAEGRRVSHVDEDDIGVPSNMVPGPEGEQ